MGEKNVLFNALLKAQNEGNLEEVERLKQEIEQLRQERAAAATGKAKKNSYTVQAGDSWYSIAGALYGDQRYAGLLMQANGGFHTLQPGETLVLPDFDIPEGELPFFDPNLFAISSGQLPPVELTPEEEFYLRSRLPPDYLAALGLEPGPPADTGFLAESFGFIQVSDDLTPPQEEDLTFTPEEFALLGAMMLPDDLATLAEMFVDTMDTLGLLP
jgi:hypothetical protein